MTYRPFEADLCGRLALVTGANSGMGKETARELARMGAAVILGCRSTVRGETARRENHGDDRQRRGFRDAGRSVLTGLRAGLRPPVPSRMSDVGCAGEQRRRIAAHPGGHKPDPNVSGTAR